jgi:hypothetical protein
MDEKNPKSSNKERRYIDRLNCFYYLRVYNQSNMELVGSVVDISTRGMKIIGRKSFAIDACGNFMLLLPEGSIFGDSISIEALCRWCNDRDDGSSESGFEFTSKVGSGIHVIKLLIDDLQKSNLLEEKEV